MDTTYTDIVDGSDEFICSEGVSTSDVVSAADAEWQVMRDMYEQEGLKIDHIAQSFRYSTREVILRARAEGWVKSDNAMMEAAKRALLATPASEIFTKDNIKKFIIENYMKQALVGAAIVEESSGLSSIYAKTPKELNAIAKYAATGGVLFDSAAKALVDLLEIDIKSDKFRTSKPQQDGAGNIVFGGEDAL